MSVLFVIKMSTSSLVDIGSVTINTMSLADVSIDEADDVKTGAWVTIRSNFAVGREGSSV